MQYSLSLFEISYFLQATALTDSGLGLFTLTLDNAQDRTIAVSHQANITAQARQCSFCSSIHIKDHDLIHHSIIERYRIALSFITFTQGSRLRKGSSQFLKKDTIRKIIEDIGETIEIRGLGSSTNSFVNDKGKLRHIIMKMLKSYYVKDPPVKRESSITPSMLRFIIKKASSDRD